MGKYGAGVRFVNHLLRALEVFFDLAGQATIQRRRPPYDRSVEGGFVRVEESATLVKHRVQTR